jgi:hypothetical protein
LLDCLKSQLRTQLLSNSQPLPPCPVLHTFNKLPSSRCRKWQKRGHAKCLTEHPLPLAPPIYTDSVLPCNSHHHLRKTVLSLAWLTSLWELTGLLDTDELTKEQVIEWLRQRIPESHLL